MSLQAPRNQNYNQGMAGTLYLIGSPIGNLGDITSRQLRILSQLDILYCEDTRVTHKLLSHFSITKINLRALPDDSRENAWKKAIHEVDSGRQVGFITDAGMPGISDPGRKLVRHAFKNGIVPQVIPGPSAIPTLLAACPFVDNSFQFIGFLPRKNSDLKRTFEFIRNSSDPVIFFDSPHRVKENILELCSLLSDEREILVGREMTKMHEEFALFTPDKVELEFRRMKIAGEFSIAVSGQAPVKEEHDDETLLTTLEKLDANGLSGKDAIKAVSLLMNVNPNRLKRLSFKE